MRRYNRTRSVKLKSLLATTLIFLLAFCGTLNYSGAIYAISFNQGLVSGQPELGLAGSFLRLVDDVLKTLGGIFTGEILPGEAPAEEPPPGEEPGPGEDPAADPAEPGDEQGEVPGEEPGEKSGDDGEGDEGEGDLEENGETGYQFIYGTGPHENPYVFPQLPERGGFVVYANSFARANNFRHGKLEGEQTSNLPEQTMSRLSMRDVQGMAGFYMAKNLTINGKPYHFFISTSGGNEELTISGTGNEHLVLHASEMAFKRLDAILLVLGVPVTKMWFLEPWNSLLVNVAGIGNTVGNGQELFFNAHYMAVERITIPNLELSFKEGHHTSYSNFEFRELIIQ